MALAIDDAGCGGQNLRSGDPLRKVPPDPLKPLGTDLADSTKKDSSLNNGKSSYADNAGHLEAACDEIGLRVPDDLVESWHGLGDL